MEALDEIIARALERGSKSSETEPCATAARVESSRGRLVLELVGGAELSLPIASLGFSLGADLSGVRVEGGGFDLYFPAIDEGAFIPELARAAIEHRLAA